MRPAPVRWASLLAPLVLASCGADPAGVPPRLKLVRQPGARIDTPVSPPAALVLRADFAAGAAGWSRATDLSGADAHPESLVLTSGSEDGRAFLALGGKSGGIFHVVPAEPHTAYELAAEARDHGLAPASKEPDR